MAPSVAALRSRGTEVGLLVSLVVRPTRDEAVAAAEATIHRLGSRPRQTHQAFRQKSDSVAFTSMLGLAEATESPWLTPYLWTGAVPYLGAPAVAIVGSPEGVADALWEYRDAGVSQFLFMGWPDAEEMEGFARDVLPAVRRTRRRQRPEFHERRLRPRPTPRVRNGAGVCGTVPGRRTRCPSRHAVFQCRRGREMSGGDIVQDGRTTLATNSLRFHWRMLQGGETAGVPRGTQNRLVEFSLPELKPQAEFCRRALAAGIDSLLVDFGYAKADPILLSAALGMLVDDITFIIAHRSGLTSPVAFVQQLNTLSALIEGRFSLNIVAGHSPDEQRAYGDFLDHDARYARTDEFLAICHAFWRGERDVSFSGVHYRIEKSNINTPFVSAGRRHPEIYIAGNSEPARQLALSRGTCWMRLGDTAENVARDAATVLDRGIEVGLRMSVIARQRASRPSRPPASWSSGWGRTIRSGRSRGVSSTGATPSQ